MNLQEKLLALLSPEQQAGLLVVRDHMRAEQDQLEQEHFNQLEKDYGNAG